MPTDPQTTERTQKDYAIEFAEYMAKSAEQYLDAVNRQDPDSGEFFTGLQSAIYEFRKRAARVSPECAEILADADRVLDNSKIRLQELRDTINISIELLIDQQVQLAVAKRGSKS